MAAEHDSIELHPLYSTACKFVGKNRKVLKIYTVPEEVLNELSKTTFLQRILFFSPTARSRLAQNLRHLLFIVTDKEIIQATTKIPTHFGYRENSGAEGIGKFEIPFDQIASMEALMDIDLEKVSVNALSFTFKEAILFDVGQSLSKWILSDPHSVKREIEAIMAQCDNSTQS